MSLFFQDLLQLSPTKII